MDLLDLRDKVIDLIHRQHRGEATVDDLYAAADAYIAGLRAYKKRTGKRLTIPGRSYLIRALT